MLHCCGAEVRLGTKTLGTKTNCLNVRSCAADGGQAEIKRVQSGLPSYEYTT